MHDGDPSSSARSYSNAQKRQGFVRWAAGFAASDKLAAGETLGNARAVTTIFGLADTIYRVLGSDSKIVFREALSADIELRIPTTQKAARLIGFEAEVDLETGLARTADWIRANMNRMPEMPDIFKKGV